MKTLLCILWLMTSLIVSAQQALKLTYPNGGEQLVAGTDVEIRWEGVLPQDTVVLEYSVDSTKTWKLINDKATGLRFTWNVPEVKSADCLIRVEAGSRAVPKALWAKKAQGKIEDYIVSMAEDKDGNIYVIGYFNGTVDFGNNILISGKGDNNDGFVAKYTPAGEIIWARQIVGRHYHEVASHNYVNSIIIGEDGSIYVAGQFMASVLTFDGGDTLWNMDKYYSDYDSFIAKYDDSGNVIWVKQIGGNGGEAVTNILINKNSIITVVGKFTSEIHFGNNISLANTQGQQYFIAQYDLSGNILSAKKIINGNSSITSTSADISGNIYINGSFGGYTAATLDFGNGIILAKSDGYGSDGFTAKFDISGKALWAKKIGGDKDDEAVSITIDSLGNCYSSGFFRSTSIDFGNGIELQRSGDGDFYLAKYSPNGETIWVTRTKSSYNYSNISTPNSLAQDNKGNIFMCGNFSSPTLDFGRGVLLTNSCDKYRDGFIAQYDKDGRIRWAERITGRNDDFAKSIIIDKSGDILVGGSFKSDSVHFGNDVSLASTFVYNWGDFYIAKYKQTPDANQVDISEIFTITVLETFPEISLATTIIDFGSVEIDNTKDSIVTAIFRNTGMGTAYFTNSQVTGVDKDQFEIISGGSNFILQSGEEHSVQLRFKPTYVGTMSAQISFEYNSIDGQPAVVLLLGKGFKKEVLKATVFIPDVSAYSGEKSAITLKLRDGSTIAIAQQKPTAFKSTIAYQNSIVAPFKKIPGATVSNGIDIDTLNITASWNGTSTELAAIPFTATLGDRTETLLELLSFQWLNDAGEIINSDTELQSGTFTLLGICGEGGERLFNTDGKANMLMISPNPVNTTTEIKFTTIEKGITRIILTDVLGRHIEIANQEYSIGEHSIPIEIEHLTQGLYILTMQTPTQIFTQQVIVEK